MKKTAGADTSQTQTIKKMRAEGATIGKIARHLHLPLEEVRCRVLGSHYRETLREFPGGKPIPPKPPKQNPTQDAFVMWLQNEVNPRLENLPEWPVGVTKNTYFESEAVWGIRVLATIDNMDLVDLAVAHRKGDGKAIFTFAKSNRRALLARWVQRQLVEWRLLNTEESKRLFKTFMRAYWSRQGKRSVTGELEAIQKDQMIYKDSLSWQKGSRHKGLAAKHHVSKDRVKDVLKFYKKAYHRWAKSKLAHIWLSTH